MKKIYGKFAAVTVAIIVLALSITFTVAAFAEGTPASPDGEIGKQWTATVDGTTITITDETGAIPATAQLSVSKATYGIKYFSEPLTINGETADNIFAAWTIEFTGVESVSGQFRVEISNSELLGDLTTGNLLVFHIHHQRTLLDNVTAENGTIAFTTTDFSEKSDFVVVTRSSEEIDAWWIWVLLSLVIVLNIVIILLLLLRKKDDDHSEPTDEETAAADSAEQPDETATEETSDTPTEEQDEQETEFTIPEEQGTRAVLNMSFTARLSQSEDALKAVYSEVKNTLLSYKKIRSRVSWKCDTFYKGRTKCAIVILRGKKLYLYVALSADRLEAKFRAKDVSAKKRFASTPALIKVSGKRTLLYAKQVIDILMQEVGAEKGAEQNVNYKIRRKSTKTLIDEGLIKITYVKSGFIAPAAQAETPAETAPAEEAPAATASDKPENDD